MVDSHYLGYELSWEDSLLDGVDNFIDMVFQHTVKGLFLTLIQPGRERFTLTFNLKLRDQEAWKVPLPSLTSHPFHGKL